MRREGFGEAGMIEVEIQNFSTLWGEVVDQRWLPAVNCSSLCIGGMSGESAQCFFHLETNERHTGDHELFRSDHCPTPLFKHW